MESGAGLKTQSCPLIIIKTTRSATAAAVTAAAANWCRSCVRLNFSGCHALQLAAASRRDQTQQSKQAGISQWLSLC